MTNSALDMNTNAHEPALNVAENDIEQNNISPTQMDPEIQEIGKKLQKVLKLFRQSTSSPTSSFLLQTPKYKAKEVSDKTTPAQVSEGDQRQSPRLKAKKTKDKSILRLAQDLVAKKCGILQEDESLDNMTLNQYLEMYRKPLNEDSMQAIIKLTEVAKEKQKKNKTKKEKRRRRLRSSKLSKRR
jgi:hypothetical protein